SDQRYTWTNLNGGSNQLANLFTSRGIRRGDRVSILSMNSIQFIELFFAAAKIGFAVVPINFHLAPSEVSYIVNDSKSCALLFDSSKHELVDGLRTGGGLPIPTERLIAMGEGSGLAELISRELSSEPSSSRDLDDVFFVGYTSGTTGFPKGCIQRHRAFVEHYRMSQQVFNQVRGEVMLIPGPLFHEAPTLFTMAQLHGGGTVVLLPTFDADTAVEVIGQERCTQIGFAVPTMLDRLATTTSPDQSESVRQIICGGAALQDHTIEAVHAKFPNAILQEFYGATEVGLITYREHEHPFTASVHRSVGKPVPGVSVYVVDKAGKIANEYEIGLVYISPFLMDGYRNLPEATAEATLTVDDIEWFTLGDLGYTDNDGELHLVDRSSHLIISGGENVYPAEIEAVLARHPKVGEVAVIGTPDREWGETVTAVITAPGVKPTYEEIRDYCLIELARFKVPKQMYVVDELPRTPSGKLQKHLLKQRLADD
ncbi:MAG: class I adenylate-forming enzyme family protein, partial [Antricoccus sp.]